LLYPKDDEGRQKRLGPRLAFEDYPHGCSGWQEKTGIFPPPVEGKRKGKIALPLQTPY
jgi:hypothetical protein